MSDERVIDLEMKLAHLEAQFEDLNGVVLTQGKVIEALTSKLKTAEAKLEDIESRTDSTDGKGLSSIEIAAQNKPPHY